MTPAPWAVRSRAANLAHTPGDYTLAQFLEDYPHFFTPETPESPPKPRLPQPLLEALIHQANACIQKDRWLEQWRVGVGLYVAHGATLALRGQQESSQNVQDLLSASTPTGVVKSMSVGDVTVHYDTQALTQGSLLWGDLNATTYGQMLASRARLVGLGGCYVI